MNHQYNVILLARPLQLEDKWSLNWDAQVEDT